MLFPDYPFCSNHWAGHENVSPDLLQQNEVSRVKRKNRSDNKKHIASLLVSDIKSPLIPDVTTLRSHGYSKYVRVPLENSPLMGSWDQSEVD